MCIYICTIYKYIYTYIYIYILRERERERKIERKRKSTHIRGSLIKIPDFFRMGTFIDSAHMRL